MTTFLQTASIGTGSVLPDDLSFCIGKKTLVKFILEAIDDLDVGCLGRQAVEPAAPEFERAMMLTLLTYCYATGVFSALDIELGTQHDRMIRYLCARAYPEGCAIRSFRRYHREMIGQCLTTVLRRVWELRFRGEDAEPIHGVCYLGRSLARWINLDVIPNFTKEAEQRIARAVRVDSMAMDV